MRNNSEQTEERPLVYIEIWNDPIYTIGKKSFLSELIYLAGGKNVGDESGREYFKASDEWVISKKPDIILCLYMARDTSAVDSVMARAGWNTVPAVRNRRVYDGFENNLVLRPGPRVLEGIKVLKEKISQ